MINRRQFLSRLATGGCALLLSDRFVRMLWGQTQDHSALVSIVKGFDPAQITREALNLIGGMKEVVKPGQSVFIKPNYITGGLAGHDPVSGGEIPHPLVVTTVVEECLAAGASRVIVGEWVERPPRILFGGMEGKEGAQVEKHINRLNRRYGQRVYLINLMDHSSYFEFRPSRTELKQLGFPSPVVESDIIISIPVLKTHHKISPVSLGMKNFMGIMPSVLYGEPRSKLHDAGIHQVIVDIVKDLQPDLTVISGIYGLEGEGVSLYLEGETVDIGSRLGGGGW